MTVPDLPSHGRDRSPRGEVALQNFVDRIVEAMEAASEPVTLVAHSRTGIAITAAAEQRPDLISGLIYLAAFVPENGESVLDLAPHDDETLTMENLDADFDERRDMLRREAFVPALYEDCSAEDVGLASSLLTPEPLQPSLTPIETTERFASLPRDYIELTQDRAVTPRFQRFMYEKASCDRVVSIDASHSAYFSRPDELSGVTEELAAAHELTAARR